MGLWFGSQGSRGVGAQGLGFGVWGLGCRIWGWAFRVCGFGFGALGLLSIEAGAGTRNPET